MSASTVRQEAGLARNERRPDTRFGISPALATPIEEDGGVDIPRLLAHADDLLSRGCRSATIFGTTGEGPSFCLAERNRVAEVLLASGCPAQQLVEGVIACSIDEAAEATGSALRRGVKAVLLAPPFYFRDAPDEAIVAWYDAVFRKVGRSQRDIILYHIPGMTGVPLSLDVIARLRTAVPGAILGVKDSACDPAATLRLLEAHGDLVILVGDETYLGEACAAGASGSICGLANFVPEAVIEVCESGRDDPRIKNLVDAISEHPVIPMVKALIGYVRIDRAWARACPPLPTVGEDDVRRIAPLVKALQAPAEAQA